MRLAHGSVRDPVKFRSGQPDRVVTSQPERPRWRLVPLLAAWLASGVALMVAAGILPGVSIDNFWARSGILARPLSGGYVEIGGSTVLDETVEHPLP